MAIHQIQRVLRPKSVEEAWQVRLQEPDAARFLAGGSDLVLYAPPAVRTLIDLSGLELGGLRREGDDLVIGATATLSEVAESPLAGSVAGGFWPRVLRHVASPLQRNLATLGGAVVRAHPWSDVVTGALALDARLEVFDGEERSVDLAEPRGAHPAILPLVLAVRFPRAFSNCEASFEKFSTTSFDVATLNCACSLRREDTACQDARVVVGGTPSLARRLQPAEEILLGRPLTPETRDAAARAAAADIDARDDRRATAAYRRRLAEVGVRRCLARIAGEGEVP